MAIAAWCTRVFRNSDGTVTVVPSNVEFHPEESQVELHEIRGIQIDFPLEGAITVKLEMFPRLTEPIRGRPLYVFQDGQSVLKEIESVHFADGTVWRAADQ